MNNKSKVIMAEKDFDLKKIAPLVSSDLFKFVNEEIKGIIEKICFNYKLDSIEVLQKYNIDILNIGAKFGVKKRNRRILPSDKQCMGRKLDGKQCTRGRKDNSEFCKSHLNKLPFGRIDDDDYFVKEPSKRGRKRKNNVLNCNKYIITHIEEIDGNNYLVDDNNMVYSFDVNNPLFLGVKSTEIIDDINQSVLKKIEVPENKILVY
jgi:hypothetical protein